MFTLNSYKIFSLINYFLFIFIFFNFKFLCAKILFRDKIDTNRLFKEEFEWKLSNYHNFINKKKIGLSKVGDFC